ncbi:hypothetical protein J2797_002462 [Paraburkholderia terricola]|jgi:hypothetical protein|uniref:Lipoprotein n=1 Tax=Paraburkholderia terricola TaxID=169427 RepID=A0A1M6QN48_9BURK|nr:hypothetical protein CUJ90_23795 [Paraburkholderia terricola]ORC53050.1 hypothetical protein B2G74_05835 [Burkholderia sp. A27]SDO40042.1 hypothetical protein SAMN05192547_1015117 [Paraburkholderia sediminicola]MDR6447032.1 hypothetical protein [Paraburkholderia terricola]MDR6492567.1 hypothetical protein [Paraburkholderia terricola]
MKKLLAIAALAVLSATLSGCWWGPPPGGGGGGPGGGGPGGGRGDGPHGAIVIPDRVGNVAQG